MDAGELRQAEDDAAFERALVDSARRDAPPSHDDVQKALERFTGTLGVALVASGDPVTFARAAHRLALKWLALGTVFGGTLVAVWFGPRLRPAPEVAPRPKPQLVAPSDARASATSAPAPLPSATAEARPMGATTASTAGAVPPAAGVRPASRLPRDPPESSRGSVGQDRASPESTLLAEVALLDSVRAKLDLGDSAGALLLIERYELKFPNGQLSKDADVLALEALSRTPDRAELTRRADRFLERAPDDPHAARVRRLRSSP